MKDMPSKPSRTRGRAILVVEDEAIIALEIAFTLADSGFDVLGPVGTIGKALTLLETVRPDAAVLDFNLHGQRCTPVAAALGSLGVPFVVQSAYDSQTVEDEAVLRDAPHLGKPGVPGDLVAALERLLEQAGAPATPGP